MDETIEVERSSWTLDFCMHSPRSRVQGGPTAFVAGAMGSVASLP